MKPFFYFLLLVFFHAFPLPAQLRIIRPTDVTLLPTVSHAEYERILALRESGELKDDKAEKYDELSVFDDLYAGYCSWYCGGEVISVTASSFLKAQGHFTYEAKNAHDFDHESVWAEGVRGYGIGEYLVYTFAGNCPRVTTVKIMNGHVKTDQSWRANSRVKRLKIYYLDEPYAILELEDSRSLQSFEVGTLGFHDATAPTWTLKFEIMDVYPGTKYEDTVISELYFDGIDVH